ncbi:MAG: mechanosensitive ion channel family protein [Gammaproteobacteria bacterium]
MVWVPDFSRWYMLVAVLIASAVLGWIACWLLFFILRHTLRLRFATLGQAMLRRCYAPCEWMLPLVGLWLALEVLPVTTRLADAAQHAIAILVIALAAWLAMRLVDLVGDMLASRYPVDAVNNLRARKVRTQFQVLRRICLVLISLLALGLMLITFPGIRALGTAVFASAGAAGIVLGLAARPVLTNMLAGIQIALAQPIRLDDSVVVEGESGTVEEITGTYVVVRLWDLRRLILPLTYFIEQPFQNWTRTTTSLLRTAFIYADYTVPVQAVRNELQRILQATPLWDGRTWSLAVTNLSERVVELRAVVSAANSSDGFNLQCLVREQLVTFLQRNYPDCLPRTRVSVDYPPPQSGAGAPGSESG